MSTERWFEEDGRVLDENRLQVAYPASPEDAQLIAAAPAMLDALRYVLDCERRDDFSDLQPVRDAIESAAVKERRYPLSEDERERCAHEWSYSGTQYGGDDESYHGEGRAICGKCGADGDA